jgi:tight adherence protein C
VLYVVAGSIALTAGLVVLLVFGLMPARSQAIKTRMSEMGLDALLSGEDAARRKRQQTWTRDVLKYLGEWMTPQGQRWSHQRRRLIWAGYRDESAVMLFVGIRLAAVGLLAVYGTLMGAALDLPGALALLLGLVMSISGWVVPGFVLSVKIQKRQKEIQKALPDALDLLVICVEAGLGLNQALVRVATEMRHVSALMTDEIGQANLAIRAGTPREQALLDMADRTGVASVRSLVTMLIQTERFGTSIAHSLRVHADSLRTKRRQQAEEAAAKTTIKMVFPLAFCIFPALFVVVLGPALIEIITTLRQLG